MGRSPEMPWAQSAATPRWVLLGGAWRTRSAGCGNTTAESKRWKRCTSRRGDAEVAQLDAHAGPAELDGARDGVRAPNTCRGEPSASSREFASAVVKVTRARRSRRQARRRGARPAPGRARVRSGAPRAAAARSAAGALGVPAAAQKARARASRSRADPSPRPRRSALEPSRRRLLPPRAGAAARAGHGAPAAPPSPRTGCRRRGAARRRGAGRARPRCSVVSSSESGSWPWLVRVMRRTSAACSGDSAISVTVCTSPSRRWNSTRSMAKDTL